MWQSLQRVKPSRNSALQSGQNIAAKPAARPRQSLGQSLAPKSLLPAGQTKSSRSPAFRPAPESHSPLAPGSESPRAPDHCPTKPRSSPDSNVQALRLRVTHHLQPEAPYPPALRPTNPQE